MAEPPFPEEKKVLIASVENIKLNKTSRNAVTFKRFPLKKPSVTMTLSVGSCRLAVAGHINHCHNVIVAVALGVCHIDR